MRLFDDLLPTDKRARRNIKRINGKLWVNYGEVQRKPYYKHKNYVKNGRCISFLSHSLSFSFFLFTFSNLFSFFFRILLLLILYPFLFVLFCFVLFLSCPLFHAETSVKLISFCSQQHNKAKEFAGHRSYPFSTFYLFLSSRKDEDEKEEEKRFTKSGFYFSLKLDHS